MCLVAALPWARGSLLAIAQILGSIVASLIVKAIFPGRLLVQTTLSPSTSTAQGFLIEMFLTFQLVITIMMLAGEKHAATFISPIGIGLSLFIAELSGVYFTGGSLNPARSFGPALVLGEFEGYHWIYWAGPLAGSVLAAGLYKFLKILEYEQANPGQDASTVERDGHGGGGDEGRIRLVEND